MKVGLEYQRIASKIFNMLKLLLQAIASNSNVQSQVIYLQRLCKALVNKLLYWYFRWTAILFTITLHVMAEGTHVGAYHAIDGLLKCFQTAAILEVSY